MKRSSAMIASSYLFDLVVGVGRHDLASGRPLRVGVLAVDFSKALAASLVVLLLHQVIEAWL